MAGINSLAAANSFLEDVFLPQWEERFTIAAAEPLDAHRHLPEGADLERLFAATEQRVVMPDFTIRHRNQHLQIERIDAVPSMPGKPLVVETRIDGSRRFRWGETYLTLNPYVACGPSALQPDPPLQEQATGKPSRTPNKPAPHHPWRRVGTLTGGHF